MKKILLLAVLCLLSLSSLVFAFPAPQARNGFSNMTVVTEYSELLKEKNARNDSLLPALDGDKAFAEVLRLNPNFWSLGGALDKEASLVTKLNAKVIFIDGIREDPFCEIDKNAGNTAGEWNVRIGVDFVSGGSNTVHIHVQQCLDYVRDQLGYAIKKGDKVVFVPPKKVLDKIKESEIPDAIDIDLQQTLLKAHEDVNLTGKCPKDIEAYIILMNVYEQVKNQKMDIMKVPVLSAISTMTAARIVRKMTAILIGLSITKKTALNILTKSSCSSTAILRASTRVEPCSTFACSAFPRTFIWKRTLI